MKDKKDDEWFTSGYSDYGIIIRHSCKSFDEAYDKLNKLFKDPHLKFETVSICSSDKQYIYKRANWLKKKNRRK